jgi:hypothetical protein
MKTHQLNRKSAAMASLIFFLLFLNTGYAQQIYTINGGTLSSTAALGSPAHSTDVGIGTANPQAKLHIVQSAYTSVQSYAAPVTNDATREGLLLQAYINNTDGYRRYADIVSLGYQNGSYGGSAIRLLTNAQNSTTAVERMRIDRNGYIGINQTAPLQGLHVSTNILIDGINSSILFGETAGASTVGEYGIEYDGVSSGIKGLNIWKPWGSHNGSGGQGFRNYIIFCNDDGNVGIGVDPANINASYKLSVCGAIRAQAITVNTGWCDFVFDKDYKLRSIEEVESFINTNGHLPEIPTTADVEKNGVSLGDVQAKLLQKVEELTLYVIDLNRQNQKLQAQVNELKK